jgi:hypothetical protein
MHVRATFVPFGGRRYAPNLHCPPSTGRLKCTHTGADACEQVHTCTPAHTYAMCMYLCVIVHNAYALRRSRDTPPHMYTPTP